MGLCFFRVKFLLAIYLRYGMLFRLERMVLIHHPVDRSRIGLVQKSDQPVNYENLVIYFYTSNHGKLKLRI